DLHQLMLLASAMPTTARQNSTAPSSPDIRGAATLNAMVRGTLQNPQISGQISANNLRVNHSEWTSLQLALSANPSQFSIQNASLVSPQQGQLTLNARATLKHWSYVPSDPIAASLNIQRLRVAELGRLRMSNTRLKGNLSVT